MTSAQAGKETFTGKFGRKVALISLGCPKNTVDSERMLGFLRRAGFEVDADPEEAEIIIINTCGFIDPAKEESIDTVLLAGQKRAEGTCRRLIVTGCLVQRYRNELEKELPPIADKLYAKYMKMT